MFRNKVDVLSAAGLLRIHLTRGKCAVVDDTAENRQLLVNHKFYYWPQSDTRYFDKGYAITWMNKKHVSLHRLILGCTGKAVGDHFNRCTLDCRRCNLRVIDMRANAINRPFMQRKMNGIHKLRRDGRLVGYSVQWTRADGGKGKQHVSIKKYEDEAVYVAMYLRNKARAGLDHYKLAATLPPEYNSARHALHPKYFDDAVQVDESEPAAFVVDVAKQV